jgi:hypothetical protein
VRILYIVGDSRSGSTVLQHLLSLQPGVHSVGELRRLGAMARGGEPCACGASLAECEFWCDVCGETAAASRATEVPREGFAWRMTMLREAVALRGGLSPASSLFRWRGHAAAAECMRLYESVSKKTGAEVLVDSSKEPDHFLHLRASYPELVEPIFLHRDGRGMVWSKMRRSGRPAENAINGFLWMQRMIETARRAVGVHKATEASYEELCRDPKGELQRLLAPHGVPVVETDLGALEGARHDIGGSPRFEGAERRTLQLDERWREEMSKEALELFERRAGELNRFRGYKD